MTIGLIISCAIGIALAHKFSKSSETSSKVAKKQAKQQVKQHRTITVPRPSPVMSTTDPTPEPVPVKLSIPRPSEQHSVITETQCDKTGKVINTNLYHLICDCEDFKRRHCLYPIGDIRRLCKHLARAYTSSMDLQALDSYKKAILKAGHGVKSTFLYLYDNNQPQVTESVLIMFDNDNKWWDIYVLEGQDVQRYGFDIVSDRWSHNQPPPVIGADLVKSIEVILGSGRYKVDKDLLKVREIVCKVNTKKQLKNLERRLQRAEQRYTAESTPAQDKKYELLCDAYAIAENKIAWQEGAEADDSTE